MADIYELFIRSIELRYDGAYQDLEKTDLKKYLFVSFNPERSVLERVMDAIVQNCKKNFGIPDVASIKAAVFTYQKEVGPINPPRIYSPPSPTREEIEGKDEIAKILKRDGIDINEKDAITTYIMTKLLKGHQKKGSHAHA